MKQGYAKLLSTTRKVVRQAQGFHKIATRGVYQAKDKKKKSLLQGLRKDLGCMLPRMQQVMAQTKARLWKGNVHATGKLVSIFEPHSEVIRKGKAAKPTEFGNVVKIQEAENQIITHYQVWEKRPSDSELPLPAVERHKQQFGRAPHLIAADAACYSDANERELKHLGVQQISIPNRRTKSPERRRLQKTRSFRRGQKWRTGSEGRISILKRRHGLNRCRYRGYAGIERWVGMGIVADTLINIGRFLTLSPP